MGTARPYCESKSSNDHAWASSKKICKLFGMGITQIQIAKRFGVSQHTIKKIITGVPREAH